MSLQDIFYLTGIIFFVLSILIFIGIVVVLFFIKQKIAEIHQSIEDKIDELFLAAAKPVQTVANIGASLLGGGSKSSSSSRKRK